MSMTVTPKILEYRSGSHILSLEGEQSPVHRLNYRAANKQQTVTANIFARRVVISEVHDGRHAKEEWMGLLY